MADPLARKPESGPNQSPRVSVPDIPVETPGQIEEANVPTPRDPEKERKQREEEEKKEIEEEKKDLGSVPHIDPIEINHLYDLFPPQLYPSFSHINKLARDLNKEIESPEICLIGKVGHGKSSILEAFLGHRFNVIGKDGASKRPVHVAFFNNQECERPRITLRRDPRGSGLPGKKDIIFAPDEYVTLTAELERRNVPSDVPIFIKYEYKLCLNMSVIDTPGIPDIDFQNDDGDDSDDEDSVDSELKKVLSGELQIELAKNSHFILCCVEELGDGTNKKFMVDFLDKVDPKLDKTIFVCTKFRNCMRKLTSTADVNKYLQTLGDSKTYFVSLVPHALTTQNNMTTAQFREKLVQSERLDMSNLEKMKFDKRYESKIGFFTLRKYVLEAILKRYLDAFPEIPKRIELLKKTHEANAERVQREKKNLEYRYLRDAAYNYANEFIGSLQKLIVSNIEGNPQQNGQMMEEEKYLQKEEGDWYDHTHKKLTVNRNTIEDWDVKLYGINQFKRLLREFKAVMTSIQMPEMKTDEIAVSLGTSHLNDCSQVASYVWVCSDIAQRKTHDVLRPLIERLIKRATYILQRLVDIADKMVSSKKRIEKAKKAVVQTPVAAVKAVGWDKKKDTPQTVDIGDYDNYPFFIRSVKELYLNFVEEKAKTCTLKCMDEFHCTRLIYWDVINMKEVNFDHKNTREESKVLISSLTTKIFNDIRDRITKNTCLKVYNFFFSPIQKDLEEILEKIKLYSDEDLNFLFQLNITREKLTVEENQLKESVKELEDKEKTFQVHSANFRGVKRI